VPKNLTASDRPLAAAVDGPQLNGLKTMAEVVCWLLSVPVLRGGKLILDTLQTQPARAAPTMSFAQIKDQIVW
jgi:hypothetical protein